jgi:pimeloyl-ACP methyl ester carboxylesterase
MKLLRRILIALVVIIVVGYLGILGGLYFFQRDLQYDRSGTLLALAETRLTQAELVSMPTSESQTITGWYEAPAAGKPVILYFRGNSQSFAREHERYEQFVADGYGFLAFDYRGFPGSPGELTQEHVLADGLAAFDWLEAKGFPIVLWGRSLGSGPATYVASERDADALLLETPFISAVQVAADRYGFIPVGWLMADQYPVEQWIGQVSEPVFVAHGTGDNTINVYHGRTVYELAPNPRELWIVEGADQDELWARGIWPRARSFFKEVEAGAPASAAGR